MMISIAPMSPSRRRLAPDVRFEIRRAAVRYEEADERLQPHERLLGGAQKAEGQAEAVETGCPALV